MVADPAAAFTSKPGSNLAAGRLRPATLQPHVDARRPRAPIGARPLENAMTMTDRVLMAASAAAILLVAAYWWRRAPEGA